MAIARNYAFRFCFKGAFQHHVIIWIRALRYPRCGGYMVGKDKKLTDENPRGKLANNLCDSGARDYILELGQ
jgi:hypothetical protein